MIKFVATRRDGSQMLFLGLSAANLELLPQDRPIRVDLAEVGLGVGQELAEVIIFAGSTENEMMEQVVGAGFITPNTKVTIDPRLR